MMKKEVFGDFQTRKNDMISQAAYELACAIACKDDVQEDVPLEWNMEFIGEIVDAATEILQQMGLRICDPFFADNGERDDNPCYLGTDCKTQDCPFRANSSEKRLESVEPAIARAIIARDQDWAYVEDGERHIQLYLMPEEETLFESDPFPTSLIDKKIREYADNFNVNEYVRDQIKCGVLLEIDKLLFNAMFIKHKLNKLADALEHWQNDALLNNFAGTKWSVDDAISEAGDQGVELTREKAAVWWAENESSFKDALTQEGNEILSNVDWAKVAGVPDKRAEGEGDPDA